jgi:hypothetical protein
VCRSTDEKDFKKKLKDLERRTNEKGKEFPKGLMDEIEKWTLAYGKRCGNMTTNMADIFNSILRGVRSLPVTAIASFTFYKCKVYFGYLSIHLCLSICPCWIILLISHTLFAIVTCYPFTFLSLSFLSDQPLLSQWQKTGSAMPMAMATTVL